MKLKGKYLNEMCLKIWQKLLLLSLAQNSVLSIESAEARMVQNEWEEFKGLTIATEKSNAPESWYNPETKQFAFASESIKCLGIGFAYTDHAREVGLSKIVFFEKNAQPTKIASPIPYRPFLDFEAEIALVLNRHDSHTFGYLLHNDLTDRKIQLQNFDESNLGPGFTLSKSFVGANVLGNIIAIGSAEIWNEIEIELWQNGELKQRLATKNNLLKPEKIHKKVFSNSKLSHDYDWVIIGTGTTAGTIFRSPTALEKIKLFIRAGFSKKRASILWLNKFRFLQEGDSLEIRSNFLGNTKSTIK